MRTYGKLLAAALALSALPMVYACDDTLTQDPLTVSPVYAKVYVGQTVQLNATFDRNKNVVVDGVAWSSTDADIAEVSQDGLVTGLKPGRVTIAAGCASHCGTALVVVINDRPGPQDEDPYSGGGR
jgi:hypothetical protein